ncbi:hypothetical protein HU200_031874 [Digitaria exilis]|uniref:RING-type E3 ubiquitin transferase n=1 Tax=Digitaria exilis TaxID=1010633 RepID=A0A835BL85_9POAL|nr:hypothetical protein HU200_031874 [Digitaria exilis]
MAEQEGAAGGSQQVVMRWRYGDVGDSNFAVHGRGVPLLVGLLCAVVFFVALCLYLRWRCHRYTPDPEAADASSSSSSPAAASPGLDADAIRGLPVTLYHPPSSPRRPRLVIPAGTKGETGGEDGDDQADAAVLCSICISALVAGEKVKVLPPCGHCFHPDCVDAWLRSQASCPLCRCLLAAGAAAKPAAAVNGSDDAV